jgi:alanine dehydrogenase
MSERTLGVVSTPMKADEKRAPLHPDHIARIDADLRARMVLERGYGERFGVSDDVLAPLVKGLASREEVFACDIVLLPKPTEGDFRFFREGQTIWGWPHCVQGPAITQVAIDKKLTLIAWEEMHHWDGDTFHLHVLHVNNELAGYGSVLHALNLAGICGHYGAHRRAAVIGFGSVGRGAIHALQGQGFADITLFTKRPGPAVRAPIPGVRHWQYRKIAAGQPEAEVILTDEPMPMPKALGHFDIIVNAILQDTDDPELFVRNDELDQLKERALIVDVSCDEGMGFEFAKPTSFADPWFGVGDRGVRYYAVDHTPSYLWNTATWNISRAIRPFLRDVMDGPEGWDRNTTIRRAIEIRDGVVKNEKILRFQDREAVYPHRRRG